MKNYNHNKEITEIPMTAFKKYQGKLKTAPNKVELYACIQCGYIDCICNMAQEYLRTNIKEPGYD